MQKDSFRRLKWDDLGQKRLDFEQSEGIRKFAKRGFR
jgi:hypothetical protein